MVTSSDLLLAALLALCMTASVFGLVLIAARSAESIRWSRGAVLFALMASFVFGVARGPEIVASVVHGDRRWASAFHDGINGALLLTVVVWQVRDALARRTKRVGSSSGSI